MADTNFDRLEEFYQRQQQVEPHQPWFARVLRSDRPGLNLILFLLTCASTFHFGYYAHKSVSDGLWYSGGIIMILLCHEMGHYFMCLRHGVRATLPFFIPFPVLSPFGTLGAVIRMDSRMPNRRALFDIGVAGPLAGLVVTLPAIYFGLTMSEVLNVAAINTNSPRGLGESILFKWIIYLVKGPLPEGQDVLLHPLAYAGWAGLFVTALNLLPVGQLDGGHILYALLGERSETVCRITLALFALMGIVLFPSFPGWFPFILLLLWFGYRHPPTMDHFTPLDSKRRMIAYFAFVVFILSFTPIPFYI